jgi:hypothetical protein
MNTITTAQNAVLAGLVAEYASIDRQVKSLLARQAEIKTALAAEGIGKHVVPGAGTFTVSENNTYSDDYIAATLTPGQMRRVVKSVIDRAKVKSLYPAVYDAAKERRGFRVSVAPNA